MKLVYRPEIDIVNAYLFIMFIVVFVVNLLNFD